MASLITKKDHTECAKQGLCTTSASPAFNDMSDWERGVHHGMANCAVSSRYYARPGRRKTNHGMENCAVWNHNICKNDAVQQIRLEEEILLQHKTCNNMLDSARMMMLAVKLDQAEFTVE